MSIARKDWLEFVRDRRLLALASLTLLIAVAAILTSYVRVAAHEADRQAAQARETATWHSQGARNPHSAAHFGEWAFLPLTAMTLVEPGVTPYAGTAIGLEAHSWNPARIRPVEDQESPLDLGAFSISWALQLLFPIVIFAIVAGLVARERERGTLRLLIVNGVSARRLLTGKLLSSARITGLLALPVLVLAISAVMLAGGADWFRLTLWCATYLVYLLIVTAIALAVSASVRTTGQALLILVGFWLLALMLVPRAGATLAEAYSPTPPADAFWSSYRDARASEPSVFSAGAEAFTAATLRRYGVSRREDLPVSLGGLQLEEDERQGNAAFDRLYAGLYAIYEKQRAGLRWASLLSPLPALQNLSQTIAGTSMPDQIDFQRQAEAHRRRLVTFLNTDLIRNGARIEYDYRADEAFWRSTPRFSYRAPSLSETLKRALPDALILAIWSLVAAAALVAASRRLSREAI